MKLLIVGGNSTLAKDILPVLARKHTVVTAGRKDCDVFCDVAKAVPVPEKTDVIINFAAAFSGTTDEAIQQAYATNVQGVLNVCTAAKKAGVKHIIQISSIFALLEEVSPFYSVYAMTKKQSDELAQFYCGVNDIPLTILRPSQIYGDSDAFAKHQPFFYQMVDHAQRGGDITIYGSNDPHRDYIHSADLAEIIDRTVAKRPAGVFVCTNPSDVTYAEIAKAAQKVFGKGGSLTFRKDKPDIPDNIFEKDMALQGAIGYSPAISIEDGIKRIKLYREGTRP